MAASFVKGGALLALATGIAVAAIGGGLSLATRFGPAPGTFSAPVGETMFTGLIFAPLAAIGIIAAMIDRGRAIALGAGPGRWLAAGVAIGLGGMLASVGDAGLAGTLVRGAGERTGLLLLVWGLLVVLFQAACEEVFFRGWLQPALVRRWGAWPALLGASVAFAVAHLAGGDRAPVSLLNLLLGGLVFGLLAQRSGGIAAAIGAHGAWNAGEQLLFGLDSNPGVGSFGAIADRDLVGAALWGGSTEGLNASVIMTAVLLAVLVPLAIASAASEAGSRRQAAQFTA